jgi:hypothetical protein
MEDGGYSDHSQLVYKVRIQLRQEMDFLLPGLAELQHLYAARLMGPAGRHLQLYHQTRTLCFLAPVNSLQWLPVPLHHINTRLIMELLGLAVPCHLPVGGEA